jgi:DNA-binding GntR family transcriptional regulator
VEIAQAIADGAADRAAELMGAHIDTTRQQFQRRIRDRLFRLTEQG